MTEGQFHIFPGNTHDLRLEHQIREILSSQLQRCLVCISCLKLAQFVLQLISKRNDIR